MAFSITSNHVGQAANGFVSSALYDAPSLNRGIVSIMANIKDKMNISTVNFNNLLQADGSSWNASGTLTQAEVVLDPTPLKVNFEGAVYSWESHWIADQMRAGANNSDLAGGLGEYIINKMGEQVGEQLEYNIWNGSWTGGTSYSTSTLFTGLLKRLDDGTAVKQNKYTLSSSNIISAMTGVYNAIPSQVKGKADLRFYMNAKTAGFYKQASAAVSAEQYFVGDRALNYLAVPIETTHGIPDDVIVAGLISNLHVGTDLTSDANQISVLDMRSLDGSDLFKYKMRMKFGTQITNDTEFVLFG